MTILDNARPLIRGTLAFWLLLAVGTATATLRGAEEHTTIAERERATEIVEVVRQNGLVRELTVRPSGQQGYRLVHGDPVEAHRCLESSSRLLPSWNLIRF